MMIAIICWIVISPIFALALARAASRPVPGPQDDILAEAENIKTVAEPKVSLSAPVRQTAPPKVYAPTVPA